MKILQWNARSLPSKWNEFKKYIEENSIDIVVIQETWFKKHITYKFKNFNIFRQDREDGCGGVAILSHESFDCEQIGPTFNNGAIESVAIKVNLVNKGINKVISIFNYYVNQERVHKDTWKTEIFQEKQCQDADLKIICGDFNAKHQLWGNIKNCGRGNNIVEALVDSTYVLLNNGSPTTSGTGIRQPSAIDLTFTCPSMHNIVENWKVQQDPMGSDHLPILITLDLLSGNGITHNNNQDRGKYTLSHQKRIFKRADWSKYYNKVQEIIKNHENGDNSSMTMNEMYHVMNEAANISIPTYNQERKVKNKRGFQYKNWWTKECSEAVAKRRLSFKIFRNTLSPEAYAEYRKYSLKAKEVINKAKEISWLTLCSDLHNKNTSLAWKIVKSFQGNKKISRNEALENKELAEGFMSVVIPDTVAKQGESSKPLFGVQDDRMTEDFTIAEMRLVLNNKRKDTATGCDDISYSMIRNMPTEGLENILNIFNSIWRKGGDNIPERWKEHLIYPILKQGKECNKPESYRPICLSSCLAKVFNSMVKTRLEWFIEHNNIIPSSQCGFRKGKGVMDHLATFNTDIHIAKTLNETMIIAALDLSKAYDNVDISCLLRKMYINNIPVRYIQYCYNWLTDRKMVLRTEAGLVKRQANRGLPQGCVLSPMLFALYIAEINELLENKVQSLQFADDILVYCSEKSKEEAVFKIQNSLNNISAAFTNMGLTFNDEKCNILIVSRRRKKEACKIKLYNKCLSVVNKITILGICFDEKHRFTNHVEAVAGVCIKKLDIMKSLVYKTKGAHPKFLIQIYKSLIRTKLDYGAFLWDNLTKKQEESLEKIQNNAMRIAVGAMSTTPVEALQRETALIPLHMRRQQLASNLALKISNDSDHPAFLKLCFLNNLVNHHPYWRNKKTPLIIKDFDKFREMSGDDESIIKNKFQLETPIESMKLNLELSSSVIGCDSKSNSSVQKLYQMSIEVIQQYLHMRCAYTDGSKSEGKVGAAVFFPDDNTGVGYSLPNNMSIVSAEIFAIQKAIELLAGYNASFVIYTDSKVAVQMIGKGIKGNCNDRDILKIIQDITKAQFKIIVQWIPGHIGLAGNEAADKLAKEAANKRELLDTNKIPIRDIKFSIKNSMKEKARQQFEVNNKGLWYKAIQKKSPNSPWFNTSSMQRADISMMCRLRFGHCRVAAKLYQMKLCDSPKCNNCLSNSNETISHLILDCPKFVKERKELFSRLRKENITIPPNIQEILKVEHYHVWRNITQFIKACKLQL